MPLQQGRRDAMAAIRSIIRAPQLPGRHLQPVRSDEHSRPSTREIWGGGIFGIIAGSLLDVEGYSILNSTGHHFS